MFEHNLNPTNIDNKVLIEIQDEQRKEYKLIGTIYVPRGMKLFLYNVDTGQMNEVHRTAETTCNFIDAAQKKKDITEHKTKAFHNSRSIYIVALNKKNAVKKLLKKYNLINSVS